ncbi:helix-turn-helix transcriptional regulator [Utexia brackfieldae]|uniref:XRE family transcriptional regulator n=1 Tax=Utexia brackfieldae TaxID=3074108 RepID=UPI00370D1C20
MLGNRIQQARKRLKISQTDIGKKVGVSKAAVSKWESGENDPKDIDLLAKALNVNINWLRTGRGAMDIEGAAVIDISSNVEEWDLTPLHDDEVEVPYYKSIELAASHGITMDNDYNGYKLRFGKSFFRRKDVQKEHVVCFPASGNSMEPVIPNGAVVAVNTARKDIIDGDIYAICQDGLCRIKRLYRLPGDQVRIVSYNAEEHPAEIAKIPEIEIIGRVFHCSFEL